MSLRELLERDKQKKLEAAKPVMNGEHKGVIVQTAPQAPKEEPRPIQTALRRFGKQPVAGGENVTASAEKPPIKPPAIAQSAVSSPDAVFDRPLKEVIKQSALVDLPKSSVEDLKKNLEFLAANIEDVPLVKQAVRSIAEMLIQNPQFSTQLPMQRSDFNLIVKGLRKSYQTAARKKGERSEKKAKFEADVDEVERLLKEIDF